MKVHAMHGGASCVWSAWPSLPDGACSHGMAWHGMACIDMAWRGHGMAWHGTACIDVAWRGPGMARYGMPLRALAHHKRCKLTITHPP